MWCNVHSSAAAKRYMRRMLGALVGYLVVLLGAARIVRHGAPHGWHLYFWSVLPAIPIMAMLLHMGRYLHEETDEYRRVQTVRALLAATGMLVGALVVNDFLRAFAQTGSMPPFTGFLLFFAAFGVAQAVQQLRDRPVGDD